MLKLTINGQEVNLTGGEKIVCKYAVSLPGEISSPASAVTNDFEIPSTQNNLRLIESSDVLITDTDFPFDLQDAQLTEGGIDLRIISAKLTAVKKNINVRLYGTNVDFFTYIKDKSLRDLDLSAYDHQMNWAFMETNLNNTTGITYPVINYGSIDDNVSVFEFENKVSIIQMRCAVFYSTILEAMITDAGFTSAGNLFTHGMFLKLIYPFSLSKGRYPDDLEGMENVCNIEMNTDQAETGVGPFIVEMNTENTDPGNNFDDTTYKYLTPCNATFQIKSTYKVNTGLLNAANTVYRLVKEKDGTKIVLGSVSLAPATIMIVASNFVVTTEIDKDWYLYNEMVHTNPTDGATADSGIAGCHFAVEEITNIRTHIEPEYNDNWYVAANLPDIKQSDFLKWVIQMFGGVISVKDGVVTINTFKQICENVYGNFDDWTDKIDTSKQEEKIFESTYAQTNHLTYQDDDNVKKDPDCDYDILITDRSLDKEKDLYVSPFGATEMFLMMEQQIFVTQIDRYFESSIKPRVLLSNPKTVDSIDFVIPIEVPISGGVEVVVGSDTDVDIPYFIDLSETYQLGWKYAAESLFPEFVSLISATKKLNVYIRINEIDINELDFFKPVLLKDVYYFKNTLDYDFTSNESTLVSFLKLP